MFVLKIATTVWLIVIVLGVAGSALNQKNRYYRNAHLR